MNFSVLNAERQSEIRAFTLAGLIREPIVKQIMRISVVFLVLLFASLQFLLATPGHGQGANETRLTLELKDETLASALKKIEKATPFRFVYRNNEVNKIERINLERAERSVSETLALILENTKFTYREMKKNILIMRKEYPSDASVANTEFAPDHQITGKVVDDVGEPLAGVSIVLKGTTTGTTTDGNGVYNLTVPDGSGVLVFSFIGFATQEVNIESRTTVDIILVPDVTALSEVVVTALGITREERSLGYATQEIRGENLTFTNEQNVIGSLAGKIAGVQVTGASGASMGGTQKIKIRGVNSINGGGEPLMVIDGTPISNANFSGSVGRDYGNLAQDINPDDVESINVLKGPAASALYGIRGQYGVIMITTKKGKKGSENFTVELGSSYMVEKVANIMPYQNVYGAGSSQTFSTLPNGDPRVSMIDESWGPKMDGTPVRQHYSFYPQDPLYGQLTPFVPHPDNIEEYYETGSNFNKAISIYGGGAKTNFRLSFNNTTINGIEPNTFLKRNNLGLAVGIDLSEKLNVSANMNFANNSGRRPEQGAERGSRYFGQWFERNLDMNRLRNYKYPDGTFLHWNLRNPSASTGEIANLRPLYFDNPFFSAHENYSDDSRDRLFGNVGLTYKLLTGLSVSGFIRTDRYTQQIDSRTAFGGVGVPGYSVGKYQNEENNYEFLAQYEKRWDDLSLNATLGTNQFDRKYTYVSQATVGGLSAPGFYNIDASIDRPSTNSWLERKQLLSAYGLVSLGFRDTYFIDASMRNDKSSALPDDNNSYWYPSVSASFVFSELIQSNTLQLGKLRLSYAKAGSDLAAYQTTPFYNSGLIYDGVSALAVPNTVINENIKPSFATSYEAGLDFNLFGRLDLAFTYYQQKNENQIIPLELSGASGFSAATINAGLIENNGIEFTIGGSPIRSTDFKWDASFNIARNRGEVVELYPGIDVYGYASTTYSSVTTYVNSYVGKPFGSLVGQAYQRDEATGKILLDDNNLPLYTPSTHDFGTVTPDYTGGFLNTFSYKNFQLSAMIDFQVGGLFFSRSQSLADRVGLSEKTAAINDNGKNVRDPVAEGGGVKISGINAESGEEITTYVDAKAYYGRLGQRIAEPYIYDATFVKLREVRLGYNFNPSALGGLPIRKIGVALIARNPLMIYQDAPKGLDPSELSSGSQAISWYESGQLNSVRSIGLDLNITF